MSNSNIEIAPYFVVSPERQVEGRELLERFKETQVKIAIQKDGEMTEIARKILESYDIEVPATPKGRVPVSISPDGQTGFLYARNKSLCSLVTEGAVDMAIVGTDRLLEDRAEDVVDIIADFKKDYRWPLILATPLSRGMQGPGDIRRIATQYPVIAQRYFESIGRDDVEIVATAGGTEIYPYLGFGGKDIDGIIDLTVTGESLREHDMVPWTPSIGEVYPVLIQRREPSEQ